MATASRAQYIVTAQPLEAMAPSKAPVILWGEGTPDGDAEPWLGAKKGSLWLQTNGTDDKPHAMIKVDEGNDDDDWMYLTCSATGSALETSGSYVTWA
jgi:hypothetical protein